ncbi:hypothetical protein FKP32DRAFT_1670419 [Trametes sanguinea]|nr:hypothetical protein FKP32DRAFT_1670419 [Trametes sanguinea]
MARTPRTPRGYSKALRNLCWRGAGRRQPYDSALLPYVPCPQCGQRGRFKQSITFKRGHAGQWHRVCLHCNYVYYPPQPAVPDELQSEIDLRIELDYGRRPANESTGGGRRRLGRLALSDMSSRSPSFHSSPILPSRAHAARRQATPGPSTGRRQHASPGPSTARRQHASPGPSTGRRQRANVQVAEDMSAFQAFADDLDVFNTATNRADPCANDEAIARQLQQELDAEGPRARKRRAQEIQSGIATSISQQDKKPRTLAALASEFAPWSVSNRSPASAFTSKQPKRESLSIAPFPLDLPSAAQPVGLARSNAPAVVGWQRPSDSEANAAAAPATYSATVVEASPTSDDATPKPPLTQPRPAPSGTSLTRAQPDLRRSVISISSGSGPITPTVPPSRRRPMQPRDRAMRPQQPSRSVQDDCEVISISSDSEPEGHGGANATRTAGEKGTKPIRGVLHELFTEDPSRTALLDSPFYGTPNDGQETSQRNVVYPWELSSSSSEDFEIIALPSAREKEQLLAAAEGAVHMYQTVTQPLRVRDLPSLATDAATRRMWYLRVVIWYRENTIPVTKSICVDGEGFITLGKLAVARQVFQDAGVNFFHLWSFRQTSWERHTLESLIYISPERCIHTLLVRMTTVQRCPLFELKLLEASAELSYFGPTGNPTLSPKTPKGKGKARALD